MIWFALQREQLLAPSLQKIRRRRKFVAYWFPEPLSKNLCVMLNKKMEPSIIRTLEISVMMKKLNLKSSCASSVTRKNLCRPVLKCFKVMKVIFCTGSIEGPKIDLTIQRREYSHRPMIFSTSQMCGQQIQVLWRCRQVGTWDFVEPNGSIE